MFNTIIGADSVPPSSSTNKVNLELKLPGVSRQPPVTRPKRSQVTRACDWCRVHRIKCDDHRPCSNCQNSGAECSNNSPRQINSLPQAFREIERLKQRIQELEREIEDERNHGRNSSAMLKAAQTLALNRRSHAASDVVVTPFLTVGNLLEEMAGDCQQGVFVSTTESLGKTWYGSLSLHFFTNRLSEFITLSFQQRLTEQCMQPHSASRVYTSPIDPMRGVSTHNVLTTHEGNGGSDTITQRGLLTAPQEEFFLGLFWQSYHTSLMILDEGEFKQHYRSLWADSREKRKPSALVDIVIAVCMQYGKARNQGRVLGSQVSRSQDVDANDASIAGCWHYHQCRTLLACELESPTLSTLQCTILAVVWLCYASFQNTACSTLALAVNMAQALGLHLPPPCGMTQREAEMRKRLWWSIYVLDAKINMELGRPFLIHQSDMKCNLPSDDHDVAALSGSNFSPLDCDVTWLTWNTYNIKFVLAARTIYESFQHRFAGLTGHENAGIREASATFLANQMKSLDSWVKEIPMMLKIRRTDGIPFSTDCSPLDLEQFAPSWVQHQRLTLELQYHNLCVTLWRPYVLYKLLSAPIPSDYVSTMTELCTTNCANHAIALTRMMHQVLTTTDILAGWYEAFKWQWNCAITLVGFAFTRTYEASSQEVQNTIIMSIEVLEIFGRSFATGGSAANVMRKLTAIANHATILLKRRQEEKMEVYSLAPMTTPQTEQGDGMAMACEQVDTDALELDEEAIAIMQEIVSESLDIDSTLDNGWAW
ncbi:fungal-specific transcription factor domain-containing protein [Xylaria flabelliformis]|nr:fungal-specific transcription factor domain-containing protein [Xylaria flabelliformis]